MVYFKKKYCSPRFQRGSIVFQGELNFFLEWDQDANFYRNL